MTKCVNPRLREALQVWGEWRAAGGYDPDNIDPSTRQIATVRTVQRAVEAIPDELAALLLDRYAERLSDHRIALKRDYETDSAARWAVDKAQRKLARVLNLEPHGKPLPRRKRSCPRRDSFAHDSLASIDLSSCTTGSWYVGC